jgi:hypothetical protein
MRSYLSVSFLFALCFVGSVRPQSGPAPKINKDRAHELTLARLRPGRDDSSRARSLYTGHVATSEDKRQFTWNDWCNKEQLIVELDGSQKILTVRVTDARGLPGDCDKTRRSPWRTGHGLRLGDSASRVIELYGEPDSRSPSTKGNEQLELLYYAFDWAGPDVPQVMEVLCTLQKDGKPGSVVEITLAAPSL